MSQIVDGKIVLCGTDTEALLGFSIRFEFHSETSHKYALFELCGDMAPDGLTPASRPEGPWDIFWSYGKILKGGPKEPVRKVLISNVDLNGAIEKIRDVVRRECKGYDTVHAPSWWIPDAPSELFQIAPMLARGISDEKQIETMLALYEDDQYIAEIKYDGHRAKAHFYANANVPLIRFDSRRQSDTTGLFTENTDQVPHLNGSALGWHFQQWVRENHGTILDGEIIHEKGIYAVASVMGAHGEKAVRFQNENGYVKFKIFDCISYHGELLVNQPWEKRRKQLDELVAEWKRILQLEGQDPEMVEAVPYWSTDAKKNLRTWAFANGYEGMILKKLGSKYSTAARTWDWVKDKKEKRFTCVVMGFEDSKSEAYSPKGWIKCVKVGQYKDGTLVEVASVGSMDTEQRQWFSENKVGALGKTVEIEAQEQNKATQQLRHPRFICMRHDKKPTECVVGQEG